MIRVILLVARLMVYDAFGEDSRNPLGFNDSRNPLGFNDSRNPLDWWSMIRVILLIRGQ